MIKHLVRNLTEFPYLPPERKLDILFGLHSGIPSCCVSFFCSIAKVDGTVGLFARQELDMPRIEGVDYVPCPRCYEELKAGAAPALLHECAVSNQNILCTLFKLHDPDELIDALKLLHP